MRKYFFKFIDLFLSSNLLEVVDISTLYRARIIVATNLAGLLSAIFLLFSFLFFKASAFVCSGVFLSICTFLVCLFLFKKITTHFSYYFKVAAVVQILIITSLIYLTAFSEFGMGFFGLIWLIPMALMIAFYFNTRFSFYFAILNFILFFIISYINYENINNPIKFVKDFTSIYYVFLVLVLGFCFMLAFFFVHFTEELQTQILKQRDLLTENAKFQSLGKMAMNLAHDINNPLFNIQGKLHQIRNLLSRDQLDLEKCDQIVDNVESTILKMSSIVKGISTFAREGRGDQMVSIGIDEIIENILALAADRIKNANIELTVSMETKEKIICYPSFISQVLLNLINNAIDALEFADQKKIEVKAVLEKEWVKIFVMDSGPGLSKDIVGIDQKIFEPFFTTKTFGKGTGLGLSISKGLIDVHEGEIHYQRIADQSVFVVKLPTFD